MWFISRSSSKTEVAAKESRGFFFLCLRFIRLVLLEFPLVLSLILCFSAQMMHQFYQGPMQTLIESYRRTGIEDGQGYMPDWTDDVTYYARQCDARDVTTKSSNDLMIDPNEILHSSSFSPLNGPGRNNHYNSSFSAISTTTASESISKHAAHTMMKHGAVLIPKLLTQETATELREYLETRNAQRHDLSWFEKFWGDIGRLSLGLGVGDAPIIGRALQEVGSNPTLIASLEGIVGPDPSLVEISTLTTLQGAQAQGIHTDSDWFGSSLLYSRTFHHSYTLFMALQDTTADMGATTVCPGTHWCANEDLSDICGEGRQSQAFEVSSNGYTGRKKGLLKQGDGMMFNQNIWHRGPRNRKPINRVMFILTFVSSSAASTSSTKNHPMGDTRQLGLGTYYYQRWNMWGHTLKDLWSREQLQKVFSQPRGAFRALGLWKGGSTKNSKNGKTSLEDYGVLWPEHFARQIANDEDFFSPYELEDFWDFLDSIQVPRWFQKRETATIWYPDDEEEGTDWEPFLLTLFDTLATYTKFLHFACFAMYTLISILGYFALKPSQGAVGRWFRKITSMYILATLFFGSLWYYVTTQSYLAHRINTRATWRHAFPAISHYSYEGEKLYERTTFPDREDILIGSRFDSPFLTSFNNVLSYHPGNVAWSDALQEGLHHPKLLQSWIASQPEQRRFLQQSWKTGYWSEMTAIEVNQYVDRQLYAQNHPIFAAMEMDLKETLAESRFGYFRDESMTKRGTAPFANDLLTRLYQHPLVNSNMDLSSDFNIHLLSNKHGQSTDSRRGRFPISPSFLDKIPVTVLTVRSPSRFSSNYKLHSTSSRQHFVQDDFVEIKFDDEREEDGSAASILKIDPFGHATVRYKEDGFVEDGILLSSLQRRRSFEDDTNQSILDYGRAMADRYSGFIVGREIDARFQGNPVWFPGKIVHVHWHSMTAAIAYDDGDFDANVPFANVREKQYS